jgi:hypothetical protein
MTTEKTLLARVAEMTATIIASGNDNEASPATLVPIIMSAGLTADDHAQLIEVTFLASHDLHKSNPRAAALAAGLKF